MAGSNAHNEHIIFSDTDLVKTESRTDLVEEMKAEQT
jgi:hypothetical protein